MGFVRGRPGLMEGHSVVVLKVQGYQGATGVRVICTAIPLVLDSRACL